MAKIALLFLLTFTIASCSVLQSKCEICDGAGEVACSDCEGDGAKPCTWCFGKGERTCSTCGGIGQRYTYDYGYNENDGGKYQYHYGRFPCKDCEATGKTKCSNVSCEKGEVRCFTCFGQGKKKCMACYGTGKK